MHGTTPPAESLPWPALAALGPAALATWALSHPYAGLFHDAGLYTLQALAHLRPDSLRADVFLKFGSQDRFTLFSPLYAAVGRWIGIEPAAALLTLASQLGLLAAAWVLARTVVPGSMALFGVALLIAVPASYGPDRIFACIEPFLTPRMAAEALALGALAAALRNARLLAAALTVAAVLLHPIMAAAGICALYWLYVGERRPLAALAWGVLATALLGTVAFWVPGRFSPDWWALVTDRSPYLFVGSWRIDDWARAAVTFATLAAGLAALPAARARTLAKVTLITSLCGLLLTYVACDLLRLVLFTQLQPWRWLWLGTVVAALLLPQLLHALWTTGRPSRTTAVLLLAAWVFASNPYALAAASAAILSLAWTRRLQHAEARWVWLGALGLLAIAVAWRVASNLEFTDSHYLDPNLPAWLRRSMSFVHDGSAPAALLAVIWWLSGTPRGLPALALPGAALAAACAVLMPYTVRSWTAREFTPQLAARWAGMRASIPAGSEVFWPDSPLGVWLLLDRPSYLSVIQTSGLVYSRAAALELKRRAAALRRAVDPKAFMDWNGGSIALTLSRQQLAAACGSGEFDFLVSAADLGFDPVAAVQSATGPATKQTRLYRCNRVAASTG